MTTGPFQLGSRIWPGLSKVVEESGEVGQVAGKLMATGGDPKHWDGTDLTVRIGEEVADLSAACRVFFQLNDFAGAPWVLEREIAKYGLFMEWHRKGLQDKPDETGPGPRPFNRFQRWLGAGGQLHHEIYWAWRVYPMAMVHTMFVAFMIGIVGVVALAVLLR